VLTAGTYHLIVTDSNGCPAVKDFTLTQPAALKAVLIPTHITCKTPGFNNGSINLTVSGGVPPYFYAWSNGAITEDINGLTAGSYKIVFTDANGCSGSDSVRVNLPPPVTYSKTLSDYNGFNISCNGLANGYIKINPTGGQAPFIYNWTGTGGFTSATKDISDLLSGQYNIMITDSNFCTATEVIDLAEPGKLGMTFRLSLSKAGGFNINCAGDNTGSIVIEPVNQVKTVSYLWADGIFGKTRMNLSAGSYSLIIIDANSCKAGSTINITEPDSIKLRFEIKRPYCPDKPDGEILVNVSGGVVGADYAYRWSDNSSGSSLTDIPGGFYRVAVNDLNGCVIADSTNLEPLNITCLRIPNAISPNGDLINDVWNIGMVELYPEMEITIFNRFGQTLWRSEKGYPVPWDGTYKGSKLPIDSYHYIINLHNGSKPFIGNVTIVR
jgi:gliding motility-associated-like protein